MLKHVLQIIACYVVGLLAGALISMVPLPLATAGFFLVGLLASPILLIVLFVFILFNESVLRHLSYWCLAAPFFVTAVWVVLDWQFYRSSQGRDLTSHLLDDWEFWAQVFACASISSALFWYLNRGYTEPQAAADKTGA